MSLILDALKKIEQDKRRPDGSQIESIAVSRERLRRSSACVVDGGHRRRLGIVDRRGGLVSQQQ